MAEKKKNTIYEVAEKAGVSRQTVSRVLNDRPDVSANTRKHVKQIIKDLNYRPNAIAQSLSRRKSKVLGVVTAGLRFIGPSRTLSGITSKAEELGYGLLIKELSHFHTNDVQALLQWFLSHQVDGIIWAVPEIGENRVWLHDSHFDQKFPLVFLTMEPQKNLTVVSIDNYLGGRLAMSHLMDQEYHQIGHIAGPLEWWEARQRMKAWGDVLNEAGIEIQDQHWIAGNWSSASGAAAMEKLLAQYPEMDSIFVANDQMALGVLQVIHQKGLSVPEDIGIVGFDNIPESAYFLPSLTSIQQDQNKVAEVAVEEIIKIIKSGWQGLEIIDPHSILLEPTLVVRRSSLRHKGSKNKGGGVKISGMKKR